MTSPDASDKNDAVAPLAIFERLQAHVWLGRSWGDTREADLHIYPGRFQVTIPKYGSSSPSGATVIDQIDGVIRVNLARLPPWLDTAIFVQNDDASCVLAMPRAKRRSLLQALDESGLQTLVARRSLFTLYM